MLHILNETPIMIFIIIKQVVKLFCALMAQLHPA